MCALLISNKPNVYEKEKCDGLGKDIMRAVIMLYDVLIIVQIILF